MVRISSQLCCFTSYTSSVFGFTKIKGNNFLYLNKRVSIPVAYAKAVATFWLFCVAHTPKLKRTASVSLKRGLNGPKKKKKQIIFQPPTVRAGGLRNVNPFWELTSLTKTGSRLENHRLLWRVASGSPAFSSSACNSPSGSKVVLEISGDKKSQCWKVKKPCCFFIKKEVIET